MRNDCRKHNKFAEAVNNDVWCLFLVTARISNVPAKTSRLHYRDYWCTCTIVSYWVGMFCWVSTHHSERCSTVNVQYMSNISLVINGHKGISWLKSRSLANERCKEVHHEISLFQGYWCQGEKKSYFVQCILQKTLCIFKFSHVHVCNGLAIEQHDCRGVFVWKLLENVVGILVFLSTLQRKENLLLITIRYFVCQPPNLTCICFFQEQ